jgi:hypothetical protein
MKASNQASVDAPAIANKGDPPPQQANNVPALLPRFHAIMEGIGVVVAPITLITSLLYYFGWVRTSTYYRYFGVDHSILNFSLTDYLIRSIDAMFLPLVLLGIIGMGALQSHRTIAAVIRTHQDSSLLQIGLGTLTLVAVILVAVGALGLSPRPLFAIPIVEPVCLLLGSALILYRASFARLIGEEATTAPWPSLTHRSMFFVCGFLLGIISLFWVVADYADVIGNGRAKQVVRELSDSPSHQIYSRKRLASSASGNEEERLVGPDSAYLYRYSGLKLLLRSGDEYLLIPATWSDTNRFTVILPRGLDLRFDTVPVG